MCGACAREPASERLKPAACCLRARTTVLTSALACADGHPAVHGARGVPGCAPHLRRKGDSHNLHTSNHLLNTRNTSSALAPRNTFATPCD
eukprot:1891631-Rhodomonas_salina.1